MANTVNLLSYANTFGDQMVTTNALAAENNNLAVGRYTKSIGTFIVQDPTLSLQANGPVLLYNSLQVLGIGSSAYVQNNLRVDTQVYFQNTILGLTNSGQAIIGGLLSANGSGIGLAVANNTTIGGSTIIGNYIRVSSNANIIGATVLGSTLNVASDATFSSNVIAQRYINVTNDVNALNFNAINNFNGYNLVITNDGSIGRVLTVGNNATISGQTTLVGNVTAANNLTVALTTQTNALLANGINSTGTTYTSVLNSNNTINTTTFNASGTAYVNGLYANNNVQVPVLNATTGTYTPFINANNAVNTITLNASGTAFVNGLYANNNVQTPIINATTGTYTPFINANNAVNTTTLNASGTAWVSVLNANNIITVPVLNATTGTYTPFINANNAVNTTTLNASGTAFVNVLSSNGAISGTNLNLSGTTLSATNVTGSFSALTTTGSVTVGGNFVLTGTTIYATNTFTISATVATPITSYFSVYRSGGANANASIRWNEDQDFFDLNNVNNGNFYRIHTDEFSSDSTTNYGSKNIATSNAVFYLQTLANTTNTSISTNVSSLQAQISQNVSIIAGVDATQNTNIEAVNGKMNSAYARANISSQLFLGTIGSATPSTPGGVISILTTNGMAVTGTSNTLTINTPQDLRTTATPTFTGLSLSTNPLAISSGGTGATSAGAALTALLPTGTTAGYVLTTGGPGSFSWSPAGSAGAGVTPGTTINSTRTSYVGNLVSTIYTTPVYVAGTNQVRVYIDGVRQHPSEYAETSGNTGGSGIVTFTSSPPTGSAILFEVDGYIINPYYANNITFTAPQGAIPITANTIQLAITDLETRKAALSGASFTGPVQAPTALISTANTQVATTSWVSTFANSALTFSHNITGTAPAGSLTGSTLNSSVTASSLTSVGTLTSGTLSTGFTTVAVAQGGTGQTTLQTAMNSFAGAVTSANYLRGNGTNVVMAALGAGDLTGTIPSAVLGNSSLFVGTTSIALNRASLAQALTGITSIDGSAATLTTTRAIYGNNFNGSAALTQIIASTYGGTGNGFTKFTGPTTAEKTFTLPDASSTIVVQGGALGTPSSGTLTNCTFPTLNQNTTGSAGSVAAGNITGTTLASSVTASSLTSFGASIALGTPASGTLTNCTFPTLNQNTSGSAATFTSTSQNSQFNSIGVGTPGSATAGEIRATNNITAFYSSDRKFKENVRPINNALDAVVAIGGKTFDWTEEYLESHGGENNYFLPKSDFGVIAQDVQSVFPQAVRTREDGSLAVDYAKLSALAFAAIIELKAEIDILKGSK